MLDLSRAPLKKRHTGWSLIGAATIASSVAALSFSNLTGWLSQLVTLPVGTLSLAAAMVLTCWAPASFGWRWGDTGRRWRLVLSALLGVVAVVGLFRLVGSGTPYEPSFGDFVIVPLGEEGLFRGFLLVVLLTLFRRRLAQSRAVSCAVVVSAIAFGVGHLGNLGYVSAQFVLLQVIAATVFGLLAGWVKVRTDSLIGPVLLHAAMNIVAVA